MILAPGVSLVVELRERGLDLAVTVPDAGTFRWKLKLCVGCDGWVVAEGPDAALIPAEYPRCICDASRRRQLGSPA